VPVGAFLPALASAVLHAGWNVLPAGAEDTRATTAGAATSREWRRSRRADAFEGGGFAGVAAVAAG
jgi:hypothetical protein